MTDTSNTNNSSDLLHLHIKIPKEYGFYVAFLAKKAGVSMHDYYKDVIIKAVERDS